MLQNPHDKFFKETFGNVVVAQDFLCNYLPTAVIQHIDMQTLEPQKDSFIDKELEETFSDLLFKANIAGQEGFLYFLFEHKSYPDKGIAFQLLRYMVDIWTAKMKKETSELPLVIPLVIYHGRPNWHIPSSLGALLKGYARLPDALKVYVPNFDHLLYDISMHADKEIKGMVQTRIALTLLRDVYQPDIQQLLTSFYRSVYYLNELEDRQTGIEYFETMIRYLMGAVKQLSKDDMKNILDEVEKQFPEGSDLTMTLADSLREEGMQQGLKQGLKQGLQQGLKQGKSETMAQIAQQLLFRKFGKLPEDIQQNILHADSLALQMLVGDIFTIESMDDVRKYLQ